MFSFLQQQFLRHIKTTQPSVFSAVPMTREWEAT
jgi:hypothetical protein